MQANATVPAPSSERKREAPGEARDLALKMSAVFLAVSKHDGGDFLREVEESGLTLTQCRALTVISGASETERCSARALAGQMGVTDSTFSRAIDALTKRDLVTRSEDEQDRRVRQIAITAEGQRLVSGLLARRRKGVEDFAASLTAAQRRKLGSALEALLENDEVASALRQVMRRTSP